MASQTRTCSSVAIDDSYGTLTWTDPNNAKVEDGLYATCASPSAAQTYYLVFTFADFAIPTGTVNGFEVRLKRTKTGIAPVSDNRVRAVKSGVIGSTDRSHADPWPGSLDWQTVGGAADLWGDTWTVDEFNTGSVKIALSAGVGGAMGASTAQLDYVELIVYYTADPPTTPVAGSVLGLTREATWGTTPTSGTNPDKTISGEVFLYAKHENIGGELSSEAQYDMTGNRKVKRVAKNAPEIRGPVRFNPGPESLGYFLTMLMGTPSTTTLAGTSGSYEAAYQHIWWPGRVSAYPVPYSLESKMLDIRSKLIQGALIRKLGLMFSNNQVSVATPEFMARRIVWLYPDSDDDHGSGTTDERSKTRPARMTSSPSLITEEPWHWRQMSAYPQIDSADNTRVTSLYFEPGFSQLVGVFTGGSGDEIGTYRADHFALTGRVTVLFETEALWQQFIAGTAFRLDMTLTGEAIQGAYSNQLSVSVYSAVVDSKQVANQIGDLQYDFGWIAQEDATLGKECQWTLINTVSSYA